MSITPKSFTVEYFGLVDAIITKCGVSEAFLPNAGEKRPPIAEFHATWDTGAMRSVVSLGVVRKLGLSPIRRTTVFHANGQSVVGVYLVNILLPHQVGFSFVEVTEGDLTGTDVLIGMDIISQGDFAITSSQGKTKFSFQIPSTHDIDFVRETNSKTRTSTAKQKQGRNDACACNSGKKYKHCCGKNS